MPVQIGEVACPRCHEDRVSLIHKIEDPRGERYVCMVCSKEFRRGFRTPEKTETHS